MAPKLPAAVALDGTEVDVIYQGGRAVRSTIQMLWDSLGKGAANGIAPLGADAKISAVYFPAFTKATVGLGNVDNTADAVKPVSALQQAALDKKTQLYDSAGVLLTGAKAVALSKTTVGGVATIYLTDTGTLAGNALFANVPLAVQPQANDSSTTYTWSWAISADRKTLTLTVKKSATPTLSLLGINILAAPAAVPDGTVIYALVVGS